MFKMCWKNKGPDPSEDHNSINILLNDVGNIWIFLSHLMMVALYKIKFVFVNAIVDNGKIVFMSVKTS